ncbi:MAG: hypothetical protein HKN13_14590, partial [Rhodothermales bacterium]|nr:hypothetical protein [Rhodothermales bacterium]
MRKTNLLAVIALSACSLAVDAFAQTATSVERNEARTETARKFVESLRTVPVAEPYGVETKTFWYWNAVQWTRASETRNAFSSGRVVESTTYDFTPMTTRPNDRFSFNENGLIALYELWDEAAGVFIPLERYTYSMTFDAVRQRYITEVMIREVNVQSVWQPSTRETNTLGTGPSGSIHITGGLTELWMADSWSPVGRYTLSNIGGSVVRLDQSQLG